MALAGSGTLHRFAFHPAVEPFATLFAELSLIHVGLEHLASGFRVGSPEHAHDLQADVETYHVGQFHRTHWHAETRCGLVQGLDRNTVLAVHVERLEHIRR